MSTLVTGGTGFIGGYVVRELAARGEDVVCFDLVPSVGYLEALLEQQVLSRVSVVRGDVTDFREMSRTIKERGVDRIVHLAAMIRSSAEDRIAAGVMCNAIGTMNVLEAACLHDVRKVAWSSSIGVYGHRSVNTEGLITNDSVHDPQSAYGASKSMSERLAILYNKRYGLDVTGVRFSTVYGFGKVFSVGRPAAMPWLDDLMIKPALRISAGMGVVRIDGGWNAVGAPSWAWSPPPL